MAPKKTEIMDLDVDRQMEMDPYPALCRSIAQTWQKQLLPERWIKMLWTAPVVNDPFQAPIMEEP